MFRTGVETGLSDEGAIVWPAPRHMEVAMKTILSALLLLSVLSGVASSASAIDAKSFFDQQDRTKY